MLKFLADENVFPSTLHILRSHNFDVKDIKELGLTEISDQAVMDLAKKEGRIIDLHRPGSYEVGVDGIGHFQVGPGPPGGAFPLQGARPGRQLSPPPGLP